MKPTGPVNGFEVSKCTLIRGVQMYIRVSVGMLPRVSATCLDDRPQASLRSEPPIFFEAKKHQQQLHCASLYLAGNWPISSLHGSWRLDRVSAGGRSHPEAHWFCSLDYR